jgi:hypothetical protein
LFPDKPFDPAVPEVPETPAVPLVPLTPLEPEVEFTYPTTPVTGLYVTTYGPGCTGRVCNIIGWGDPEIINEPVITADPEKGKPTPWTNIVTPSLFPVGENPVTVAEPLMFIYGTLALTNVPF